MNNSENSREAATDFDAWWYLWLSQRQTANKPAAIDAARAGWSAAIRAFKNNAGGQDSDSLISLSKLRQDKRTIPVPPAPAASLQSMQEIDARLAKTYWNGYISGRTDERANIFHVLKTMQEI